jgi:hypothetical protein
MAKNAFTGKYIPSSDVEPGPDPAPGGWGYTFANKLDEYDGTGLLMVGLSEPSEGKSPFDKFTPVDPASMDWAGGDWTGAKRQKHA